MAVCDHDAVTYRPSFDEMGNFPKFLSKAFKEHASERGGILIIPPPSNHQILLVPIFVSLLSVH
jgi:hypothetical protein